MFRTELDHTADPAGVITVIPFCFVRDLHHLVAPRVQCPILPLAMQTSWNYSLVPRLHNNHTQVCEYQCNRIKGQNKMYGKS
jgi:hypothetical protein